MSEFVNIQGLDGLLDAMKQLPPELISKSGGPCKTAMRKGAQVIRDEAKQRVAVGTKDTVHVRDNIVVTRDPRPRSTAQDVTERFVVRVKKKTFYWGALEFGNENQVARPFLRPAFESKKEAALDTIVEVLKKGVATVQRKVAKGR